MSRKLHLALGALVKVSIDPELCQGHAVCFMTAPDLFHLRDSDGQLGADSCPERAISVS
jgi:ferredoxin